MPDLSAGQEPMFGLQWRDIHKPAYCLKCKIKNCEKLQETEAKLCYECDTFSCARIKHLDKRYRTKYEVNVIQNLEQIRDQGMDEFIKNEETKWACKTCGTMICMHRGYCLKCQSGKVIPMKIKINERENSKIAVIESSDILIHEPQDALDLMATIMHLHDCNKIVINESVITKSFFDLKTGIAGEILQKFSNYQTELAIVGDFSNYNSKSLRDLIFESNKGSQVLFLSNEQEAIDRLHAAK